MRLALPRIRKYRNNIADFERALSWHAWGGKRFFRRYAREVAFAHKWIFIVGCNNSATTLLTRILDRPGLVSRSPSEGQYHTNVLVRARRPGHERVWSEYVEDLRLTAQDSGPDEARLVHDWMGVLPAPIHELILEKTTVNAVRMPWLQKVFPRSYFIGLVRNGFAVSEGIRRRGGKSIDRAARHWNAVNKIMVQDSGEISNYMELKYEDLVSDRTRCARDLADFIGIEPSLLEEAVDQKYMSLTAEGMNEQSIQDFNASSIERLSDDDIATISAEAGEMLNHFGYTAKTG